MILHIMDAEYMGDYSIKVLFNNGDQGIVDLKDSLKGKVFEPLTDKKLFSRVRMDKELNTIVWPNGADFAPEYVYFKE